MKGNAKQQWRCVFEAFLTANKTPCERTIPKVSFYCVVKELWINRNHRKKDKCYKWEVLEMERKTSRTPHDAGVVGVQIWLKSWLNEIMKMALEVHSARSRPLGNNFSPSSRRYVRTGIPHRVSELKQKWCISKPSHQFKTFAVMHIQGADEHP